MAHTANRTWATLDPFLEGGPLLGRKVANSTFLKALLHADPYDAYHFFLSGSEQARFLQDWAHASLPPAVAAKISCFPRPALQRQLGQMPYHCMHLSDALTSIPQLAALRNAFSPTIFPITGTTHSLSYTRYMPAFAAHLWPGTSSRDRIIATSRSAQSVLANAFAVLRAGLPCLGDHEPRLSRIPLGVNPLDLPTPEERWDHAGAAGAPARGLRERLEIEDQTVFLCLSRFSPYSKMDLMPLLAAFGRAGKELLHKPVLVMAGWADKNDALPEMLRSCAQGLGIDTRLVIGPDDAMRRLLYAAADVFVSPSDNIQETFGLTIAEAAMASLPVIASDFDGYRDIAIHEKTALLVPTLGFASSAETDIQAGLWYDNQYHLKLAQEVVVDVPKLATAIVRLGNDENERRTMGAQAHEHARQHFSWDIVIRKHIELWDTLAAAPLENTEERRLRQAQPPYGMQFSRLFSEHCSAVLDEETLHRMMLQRTPSGNALYKGALPLHTYSGMEYIIDQNTARLLLLSTRKPVNGWELFQKLLTHCAEQIPEYERRFAYERAQQIILWALKQDYIERME